VATTLFEFNMPAIDLLSGVRFGADLNDLLNGIEEEVRSALTAEAPGQDYEVEWADGGLSIGLTGDQAEREFGTPSVPMQPHVRNAVMIAAENVRPRLVITS
jgi:hypothetical protein